MYMMLLWPKNGAIAEPLFNQGACEMLCQPSSTEQNKHNCCTPSCTQYTIKFGKKVQYGEVVPSIKNYLFLFFGLRGSRIAARLTFVPKKMQFYCPFSSSYPRIFTYLLYCFSFLWNSFKLSPRHRGRRGCPSYCFVGVWANYLGDETDLACQFSSSKPTKPLFGKSIIHYTWGSQFQRNPDPKRNGKIFHIVCHYKFSTTI